MADIPRELADSLISTAHDMADAAGRAILPHFRASSLVIDDKGQGGFDPVTAADRSAERAMRDVLRQHRPHDAILGEEFGRQPGTSGLTWVIDPIDGTRGFMAGTPTWGVLVAVGDAAGPCFGIIDQPYTQERFWGGLGQAAWRGPHGAGTLGTRACDRIEDAVLFTTFPEIGTPEDRAAFTRVAERAKLVRYGMDCYAYALVAAGQIDAVIEAGLQAYDIHAPIAVIEAAGGVVTDWRGGPAHAGGRIVAAGDARLHAQALELLEAQA